MSGILFSTMQQQTPQACLIDTTPPSGGVLSTLVNNPDGSLKATWTGASDSSAPFRYEIYIQKNTSIDLFNVANIVAVVYKLTFDIFRDASGVAVNQGENYFVGVRAVDALGNRNSNTTSLSIIAAGIGYNNLLNLIPGKVWDELEADHSIAGSFGKLASDMKIGLDALLARLTLARANLLDNLSLLDVAISSRLADASFVAPDNSGISLLNTKLSNARAVLLDNLIGIDASISSRASAAGLSAVNSNVLLTQTEANALNRYNNLISAIGDIPVVTPPSAAAIADAVWDSHLSDHNATHTFGIILQQLETEAAASVRNAALTALIEDIPVVTPPTVAEIADAVWNENLADHLTAGSTGKKLNDGSALDANEVRAAVWDAPLNDYQDPGSTGEKLAEGTPINVADIAAAVWDEPLADHLDIGSTGNKLNEGTPIDPSEIADAVWDEVIAGHTTPGSTGRKLSDTFEASGFIPAGQAVEVTFGQDAIDIGIDDRSQIEVIIE